MRFRVIAGNHTEAGVRYTKNAELESERPLDLIFRNKFERLDEDGHPVPSEEEKPTAPKRRRVAVEDEEENADEVEVATLVPKHKGGGRWVVLNEETGEQVNDGYLSKAEAYEMAGAE